MPAGPLVFITSTNPTQAPDQDERTQIRKQAMGRAARARRQRGDYKHNLGQCLPMSVCRSPHGQGYESLRIRYNLDLVDLSALTSFHVSSMTAQSLSSDPTILKAIIGHRQWSYLSFVPGRFHSDTIRTAAECVCARIHQWLMSPAEPPSVHVLHCYVRALQAVQADLESEDAHQNADVLCAVELLALFEVGGTLRRFGANGSSSTLRPTSDGVVIRPARPRSYACAGRCGTRPSLKRRFSSPMSAKLCVYPSRVPGLTKGSFTNRSTQTRPASWMMRNGRPSCGPLHRMTLLFRIAPTSSCLCGILRDVYLVLLSRAQP